MRKLFIPILISMQCSAQYFTKISNTAINADSGDSRSVNWIDINNDDLLDCFVSNGPSGGQNNFLYVNTGGGNFLKVISDTIVNDHSPSDGATFADYNNDGTIDAFVVNWYNVSNLLYENNTGSFTRVSNTLITNDLGYSETASWGDYDKDGLVDLYVCNSSGNRKNFLYHNDGNGSFTKITSGTPVTEAYYSRCVNWTDIDNDGDVDLFIANENNQHENIYRNDGNGSFVKITTGSLITNAGNTMSGSWSDYDNDGDMDIFLANDGGFNALFRNEGNFAFTKVTGDTTVTTPAHSFSSAWSDVDNDGDEDLFVTNSFNTIYKNYLYLNEGNGTFTRNTSDIVTNDSAWSYGCAFGDYDNDGFQDLLVATCRLNGADMPQLLYHNNGNSNHWLTVKLTGTTSNKQAIGTRIYVKAVINGNTIWQMREISAQSSYCGQNDMRAHFGLGNSIIADSIKVSWPSGLNEYYTNIPADQFITMIEGNTTGIAQNKKSDFVLFPNPCNDKLILKYNDSHRIPMQFFISDVNGKTIPVAHSYTNKSITIDLKSTKLCEGIYTIRDDLGNSRTFILK